MLQDSTSRPVSMSSSSSKVTTSRTVSISSSSSKGKRSLLSTGRGSLADLEKVLVQSTNMSHNIEDEVDQDEMSITAMVGRAFINIVIIVNFVVLGIQVQIHAHGSRWEIAEQIFTAVFTAEMVIKIWKMRLSYFMDNWERMNFVLTWMSIFDVWLMFGQDTALRAFSGSRVIRLLRLFRVLRILQIKTELVVLVEGLAVSVKALTWIAILLFIVIYTSALFVMSALEDKTYDPAYFDKDMYFGTLGQSMLTLFNICILVEWQLIVQPMYETQVHIFIFLLMYVFLATFAILNLVIGVIAERTMASHAAFEADRELKRKSRKMQSIKDMAEGIFDDDVDGELEMAEMEALIDTRPELKQLLMNCDLPRGFDIGNLHLIFDEQYGGALDKAEFLNGMYRLIYNNEFQRDCCTHLAVSQVKAELINRFTELGKKLRIVDNHVSDVDKHVIKESNKTVDRLASHATSKITTSGNPTDNEQTAVARSADSGPSHNAASSPAIPVVPVVQCPPLEQSTKGGDFIDVALPQDSTHRDGDCSSLVTEATKSLADAQHALEQSLIFIGHSGLQSDNGVSVVWRKHSHKQCSCTTLDASGDRTKNPKPRSSGAEVDLKVGLISATADLLIVAQRSLRQSMSSVDYSQLYAPIIV